MSRYDVAQAMRDAQRRSMLDYGAFERGFYGPDYKAPTRSMGVWGRGGIGSDYARAGGSYPYVYDTAATIAANAGALGAEAPRVPTPKGIGSDYAAGGARGRYSDPQVAALQQDLNTLNAGLTVDGIMGPKTRAAMSKYSVVSTPGNRINVAFDAAKPVRQLGVPYAPPAPAATARIPQPRPAYTSPATRIAGAFDAAKSVRQLSSPYANSTGGANALTARIPQPRPPTPQWALPVQQAALPPAPLMYQMQQAQMLRNAAAAAQREAQTRSSSQGSRSGMGYSGGGYSSGGYSGSGGRSINTGVGGAFKSR